MAIGIAPQLADRARRGRRGFAAGSGAQECSVLPIEGLAHQRHDAGATSAEQNRVDGHAVRGLPIRGAITGHCRAES